MARETKVILTDDLDGSADARTVEFGLDQTNYEIELSQENEQALREALAPYIAKARKAAAKRGPGRPRTSAAQNSELTAQIRSWAKEQNMEVSERGRIPKAVIEAYHAAH